MNNNDKNYIQLIYRLIVIVISFGFFIIIWPYISSVVTMLIFAFLFTTILLPLVDQLESKIKSRGISIVIVTISLITTFVVFLKSFASGMVSQAREFSKQIETKGYDDNLNSLSTNLESYLNKYINIPDIDSSNFVSKLNVMVGEIIQNLMSLASAIGGFIFTTIMVLIFTIILLSNYYEFKKSIVQFIPNKYFEMGLRVIFNIERQVSKYLQGQLLAASSVALMSFIGLSILNLMGANLTLVVFIAIIAGLANLIPLVGPFAGMLPAILIAIMNNIGFDVAINHQIFNTIPSPFYILDIIIMFLIVQQIDNNIITPILVGESVGIHPLIVMISLLIGGTLIGPIGMLLAVPAAGILKVIGVEIMFLRRNAHLL
jgi:predicted PurR-regulated permease PerM